jgi:hypothetical protein
MNTNINYVLPSNACPCHGEIRVVNVIISGKFQIHVFQVCAAVDSSLTFPLSTTIFIIVSSREIIDNMRQYIC